MGGDFLNSFMSWVGGKKALRDEVLSRFPLYYERYIEVFGGAGWVLFHKPPSNDVEVYNDFNPNLANLYRCVRDKPQELMENLRYCLNSREDFNEIAKLHKNGGFNSLCDIDRASKFYQLIRYSYASGLQSFGSQPHSMWSNFPLIDMAARRLQRVVIENKDFEKLISQYDREVSFFYCDPPYYATESYYSDVGFTSDDHIRLRDSLLKCNGKFLISYNDCPEIRELYDLPNIRIEAISRLNNLAQRYEGGSQYAELLISNYETAERKNANRQMTFFDEMQENESED
jgi:DNA adenine methylase